MITDVKCSRDFGRFSYQCIPESFEKIASPASPTAIQIFVIGIEIDSLSSP